MWVGVTAVSTAMVWTATSIVASDVTDRPAPIVAHRDVVSQLASGASAPTTTTSTTIRRPTTTTTTTRPPSKSPTTTARAGSGVPTTVPHPAATTVLPPATAPPTTATTVASPATATFSTAGGVVRVACSGGIFINLVSAIPANGFAVKVNAAGPANVDVHFVGDGQDLSVKAVCFGQPIRYTGTFPGSS
jgi:hypothetical protein